MDMPRVRRYVLALTRACVDAWMRGGMDAWRDGGGMEAWRRHGGVDAWVGRWTCIQCTHWLYYRFNNLLFINSQKTKQ